ncbi:MAG: ABC transporter substrate-binding protein [Actinomycetota bacterium]
MKIVSLLPSATEIVFALGLDDSLEGVSFECDFPPQARSKAIVSGTALPTDTPLTPKQIDDAVSETIARGEPIYTLDADRIGAIQPDLILAQDLCRVCAVPSGAVDEALGVLGCRAEVLSLDPAGLDEVIACIGQVGEVTGTTARADALMAGLRERLERVRRQVAGRPRPRTFMLEWSDPPFNGGHWVPDMVVVAGGEPVLAVSGEASRRLTWPAIGEVAPEVVVFMPCGYGLDEALTEGAGLLDVPELAGVARVWATDASALFSRPGPRLVDGVEALAWALHSDAVAAPPPGAIAPLR